MYTTMLDSYYSLSFSHERAISHASHAYTQNSSSASYSLTKKKLALTDWLRKKSMEVLINQRYNLKKQHKLSLSSSHSSMHLIDSNLLTLTLARYFNSISFISLSSSIFTH